MKIKTNIQSITWGTAIAFIILMLIVFSCRTAKKSWVEENFTSQEDFNKVQETTENYINSENKKLSQSFTAKYSEFLEKFSNKETTIENENTSIKIDIEAEEGKEKSATVGNTKVTSNGAKISVETLYNKAFSKDFENYKNESKKTDEQLFEENLLLENRIEKFYKENITLREEIKQIKESQSRTVTKKQLGLGIVILVVIYFLQKFLYKRI